MRQGRPSTNRANGHGLGHVLVVLKGQDGKSQAPGAAALEKLASLDSTNICAVVCNQGLQTRSTTNGHKTSPCTAPSSPGNAPWKEAEISARLASTGTFLMKRAGDLMVMPRRPACSPPAAAAAPAPAPAAAPAAAAPAPPAAAAPAAAPASVLRWWGEWASAQHRGSDGKRCMQICNQPGASPAGASEPWRAGHCRPPGGCRERKENSEQGALNKGIARILILARQAPPARTPPPLHATWLLLEAR